MLIAHGTVFGRDDTAKQAPFNSKKLLDTEITHRITGGCEGSQDIWVRYKFGAAGDVAHKGEPPCGAALMFLYYRSSRLTWHQQQ